LARQKAKDRPVGAFAGDREDPLALIEEVWRGVAKDEANKRPNGRQPGVAGARYVLPVFFQVVEKGKHKIGVEIVKGNLVYGFLPRTSYELEQKAEGVAVSSDGVWAGLLRRTQVFKKALQQNWKRRRH